MRIIYADGERLNTVDSVLKNPRKVFAVIGPFDGHLDKTDLQDALLSLLRRYAKKQTQRRTHDAIPH